MLGTASLSAYEKGMDTGPKIAQVAAVIGDPARANMLSALMDGLGVQVTLGQPDVSAERMVAPLAALRDSRKARAGRALVRRDAARRARVRLPSDETAPPGRESPEERRAPVGAICA